MKEYSYLSKRSNNVARNVAAACFFFAVIILAVISVFPVPYLGVFQAACAVLFAFAVLLLTRFLYKSYLIKVIPCDDGHFDLTVTELYSRGETTVCRVSLDNVERVAIRTDENKKELRAAAKGRRSFSYCPDMRPERECYVYVTECGESLLIKISPDDTLLDILMNAEKNNQEK